MSCRHLRNRVVLLLGVVLAVAPAVARADDDAKDRTGSFQIKITERSKESAIPSVVSRLGWESTDAFKKPGVEQDYDLADESFEAYVPPDYTGETLYGLFVWVDPGDKGEPPNLWLPVLEKHKLIWIGPNRCGNNRPPLARFGITLDAVAHMQRTYRIDPGRVYVSGASGGGKCASMLGIAWPDVFTGGCYPMIGCNFYRRVYVTPGGVGRQAEYVPQSFKRPPGKLWEMVTKQRRHVLLTGDTDFNKKYVELMAREAKKDGFAHVTYLQVPGMGHQAPSAEWFEKGIVALDDRSGAVAPAPVAAAKAPKPAAARPKPAPAPAKANEAVEAAGPEADADKLLKLARLYVENRLYNKAREKLKQLVKDHPGTPQAREGEKLLKEIGKG